MSPRSQGLRDHRPDESHGELAEIYESSRVSSTSVPVTVPRTVCALSLLISQCLFLKATQVPSPCDKRSTPLLRDANNHTCVAEPLILETTKRVSGNFFLSPQILEDCLQSDA